MVDGKGDPTHAAAMRRRTAAGGGGRMAGGGLWRGEVEFCPTLFRCPSVSRVHGTSTGYMRWGKPSAWLSSQVVCSSGARKHGTESPCVGEAGSGAECSAQEPKRPTLVRSSCSECSAQVPKRPTLVRSSCSCAGEV